MTSNKVKLSFALFLFLLPIILSAQVRVGLGGGGYFGLKDQGINAGLQVQKELSDFSSLTLQVALIDKPSNLPRKNLNPDFDYISGHVSYLVLPIEYQYFLPFKKLRAGAFGGPYFAYGLKAGILKKLDDFSYEKMNLDFADQGIRRFDVGVHLGIGVELELPRLKRMFVRLNYALGLVDIDLGEDSAYQEGVGILMGFMVPINASKYQRTDK
jgi:hypothetical protein